METQKTQNRRRPLSKKNSAVSIATSDFKLYTDSQKQNQHGTGTK